MVNPSVLRETLPQHFLHYMLHVTIRCKSVTRFHFFALPAKRSLRAAVLFEQAKNSRIHENDDVPYFFRETKKAWYRLAYALKALVNPLS